MQNHESIFLKYRKAITFSLIFLILLVIIITIAINITRAGKIAVEVFYAPFNSTLTLNDQKIHNRSTIYLEPGQYQLIVTADNFTTHTQTITIDEQNNKILGLLTPENSAGEEYQSSHQNEFILVEGKIGNYLNEQGSKIKQQYPILTSLPNNNSLYSLSYSYQDNIPILKVKSTDQYLDAATTKLKSLAEKHQDNLLNYDIIFENNQNPFTSPQNSTSTDPEIFLRESFAEHQNLNIKTKNIDDYIIATLQLYDYQSDTNLATYRAILKKQDNTFIIFNTPQPLLTVKYNKNIPENILKNVNEL